MPVVAWWQFWAGTQRLRRADKLDRFNLEAVNSYVAREGPRWQVDSPDHRQCRYNSGTSLCNARSVHFHSRHVPPLVVCVGCSQATGSCVDRARTLSRRGVLCSSSARLRGVTLLWSGPCCSLFCVSLHHRDPCVVSRPWAAKFNWLDCCCVVPLASFDWKWYQTRAQCYRKPCGAFTGENCGSICGCVEARRGACACLVGLHKLQVTRAPECRRLRAAAGVPQARRSSLGAPFTAADLTFAALAAPALVLGQEDGYGAWMPPQSTFPAESQRCAQSCSAPLRGSTFCGCTGNSENRLRSAALCQGFRGLIALPRIDREAVHVAWVPSRMEPRWLRGDPHAVRLHQPL